MWCHVMELSRWREMMKSYKQQPDYAFNNSCEPDKWTSHQGIKVVDVQYANSILDS